MTRRTAIVRDLMRFHEAGGAGFWQLVTQPLPAISRLEVDRGDVGQRAGGNGDSDMRKIKAAIRSAAKQLEPQHEQEAALHLLGFSEAGSRQRTKTARVRLAASAHGCAESTYRKTRLEGTLDLVAASLLTSAATPGNGVGRAPAGAGPPDLVELDHKSRLPVLADELRRLPTVDVDELGPLTRGKLGRELRKVLAHVHQSVRVLQEQQTFVSWSTALDLRTGTYEEDDWVYVLARRERTEEGFREQRGWPAHVRWLEANVHEARRPPMIPAGKRCGGGVVGDAVEMGVNQIRVVIADDYDSAVRSVAELRPLHRNGTLFYLPYALLAAEYEELSGLRFGLAVSTKHRYAMVSVPPLTPAHTIRARDPSTFVHNCLEHADHYDSAAGDMRAIVTASPDYVGRLIDEFGRLVASRQAVCIPSGRGVVDRDGDA